MKFRIPKYIISTRDSPVKVYSEIGFRTDNIYSAMMFKDKNRAELVLSHIDNPEDYVLVEGLFEFEL